MAAKKTDPEDTFEFVDKRRVGKTDDTAAAADDTVAAADEAPAASVEDAGVATADDVAADLPVADEPEEPQSEATPGSPSIYDLTAYVIGLFTTEAWQLLGMITDPVSKKVRMDLKQARLAIDCVAALVQVVDTHESELAPTLRAELRRTLNDLRLNYVDRVKRT